MSFITEIAPLIQKYAPNYGIKVVSPIIAQACLESNYGKSKLSAKYYNYFGLKCGTKWTGASVNMATNEEYTAGTLTKISANFRAYSSMDDGVKGYFEFIQLSRYHNLRGITDPLAYLNTIKSDGYATSTNYVTNCMAVVNKYNLTQYDGAKKMSAIESAIQWMETKAKDNAHGYDQTYRWGQKGDYDCSSAVISAWEQAGIKVKSAGATYTGNMLSVFLKCGFSDVTAKVNRATSTGLLRGDVLLNTVHHTAMYCGNGQEVEASINEKRKATGGIPGDQTGKEFLIRSYRNYPWTNVLRYTGISSTPTTSTVLRKGSTGDAVKTMQTMLNACGYDCGTVDGDFGAKTYNTLLVYQKAKGLIADGEYGTRSKESLEASYKALKQTVQTAKGFSKSLAGTYKVNATELRLRLSADTTNLGNVIANMPRGATVTCYGYYNTYKGVKWLYVVYKDIKGYCSLTYLRKV